MSEGNTTKSEWLDRVYEDREEPDQDPDDDVDDTLDELFNLDNR